jgi:hypothetical protein
MHVGHGEINTYIFCRKAFKGIYVVRSQRRWDDNIKTNLGATVNMIQPVDRSEPAFGLCEHEDEALDTVKVGNFLDIVSNS